MPRWMVAVVVLLLFVTPVAAQRVCNGGQGDFHCWATWSSDNLWRNHPVSHGIGGVATALVARGPWFSTGIRRHFWGRMAVTVVVTGAWEYALLKEYPDYRWSFAAYDMGAAVSGALITEGVAALLR